MYTHAKVTVFIRVASCQNVRLLKDGQTVAGNWGKTIRPIQADPEGRILERFVNARNDEDSILAWTRKYGPLRYPPIQRGGQWGLGLQSDGREFPKFKLNRWRQDQHNLRDIWEGICGVGPSADFWGGRSKTRHMQFQMLPPYPALESMMMRGGRVSRVTASDMLNFLEMAIYAVEDRLRVCPNPDCKGIKWFVAQHGRQQLCSRDCLVWSRKEAQKKYWHSARAKQRRKQRS